MADMDNLQEAKNFYLDVPMHSKSFFLKGSNSLDWGMKNRLAQIFNPVSGKSVMLAVDHGYFQGPTTGLERIDLTISPLVQYADALMITRGALRTSICPEISKPIVLRSTGGQSILKELSNELVAADIRDVGRLNAAASISDLNTNINQLAIWSRLWIPAIVMVSLLWQSPEWGRIWCETQDI
jgi:putative autoinducer-2 (AI-2) aldolase